MPPPLHPPRLAHLCTRAVVVRNLVPTYAGAHDIDFNESAERLDTALKGALLNDVLDACWTALRASFKRVDDAEILDKVAKTLKDHAHRKPKVAPPSATWSAFMVLVDLEAGTAGDAARKVMETAQGRQMAAAGLAAAGKHLAEELLR
jgi:hypothetical protein